MTGHVTYSFGTCPLFSREKTWLVRSTTTWSLAVRASLSRATCSPIDWTSQRLALQREREREREREQCHDVIKFIVERAKYGNHNTGKNWLKLLNHCMLCQHHHHAMDTNGILITTFFTCEWMIWIGWRLWKKQRESRGKGEKEERERERERERDMVDSL